MLEVDRTPTESKITVKGHTMSRFVKATYNLFSHDISLFGFEESVTRSIWHEIMHKALWETEDIPEEATRAWDNIAGDITKHLNLPMEEFHMNYKTIREMKKK